ncbi:recombination regulator RecX [Nonomuraea sp. PA05]|uniref:recombination regulator RecX n=1 Tax=Nonomuraea sp. PA05 TaxID=2604466 RepID=UPI0011D48291|nr:recombination regulator RecX [Nonomuraea sp. PA05]TYB58631.1 recombination regulator RecX [Nonomuraea sp. PA05]
MSSTDRPQAPQPPDRGAWPDPSSSPSSSRTRDLARSASDGWPSVSEWREQRDRTRAAAPSTSDGADEDSEGDSRDGSHAEKSSGSEISHAEISHAEISSTEGSDAEVSGAESSGSEGSSAKGSPQRRRPGDEWHSEVLAGSSWFAAEPSESTGQESRKRGRRSGGFGDDAGQHDEGPGRLDSDALDGRRRGRRSGSARRFGGGTGQSDDGPGQSDDGPGRSDDGAGQSDGGLGSFVGGAERHDEGAGSFGGDAGQHDEGPGWFGRGIGQAEESAGRFGSKSGGRSRRGGRKSARQRGWLPDGPDAETTAATSPQADPESVARAICLRLLTMAPKTRAQLAEALRKRDVPEEAAEAVLSRFSELGLINDEAFAAAWVDSRHHGRGLAKRALAAELRRRGVDGDTVNEAVERLNPDQEEETARRLVGRKLASTRSLDPQTRTRRLAGMLARKGYPSGLAFRVIREALEQEGIEVEEDFS